MWKAAVSCQGYLIILLFLLGLTTMQVQAHICDGANCEPDHDRRLPDCESLPPGAEVDCQPTAPRPPLPPSNPSQDMRPAPETQFLNGVAFVGSSLSLALPLIALAIGAGMGGFLCGSLTALCFVIGTGAALTHVVAPPPAAYASFASPALLFLGSIVLLSSRRMTVWLLPCASLPAGYLVALSLMKYSLPGSLLSAFAAGGLATVGAGFTLIAVLWSRLERPWFAIVARIIGSWQLAATLLLFGLAFRAG